jgi:hypothetical protein
VDAEEANNTAIDLEKDLPADNPGAAICLGISQLNMIDLEF